MIEIFIEHYPPPTPPPLPHACNTHQPRLAAIRGVNLCREVELAAAAEVRSDAVSTTPHNIDLPPHGAPAFYFGGRSDPEV